MFQFNQNLILVNHGLVLISDVKSPVIWHLLSVGVIRGLEIAWDSRFTHIIYRCLKHDKPSHTWRTNALTVTNQPGVGNIRQFYIFIDLLISPWLQTMIYLIPHPCARKDLYNHAQTQNLDSTPNTHKGRWRGALMFSLICVWINGWVNNGEAGDLRRNRPIMTSQ